MKSHGICTVMVIAAIALVTACGGADDASTADATDKYAGTWRTGCLSTGTGSETEILTLRKVSASQIAYDSVITRFATTNCTGTVTMEERDDGTVTTDGQAQRNYQGTALEFDLLTVDSRNTGEMRSAGTILPNGQLVVDFVDSNQRSSTRYPEDPNEGQLVFTKQQ